MSERTDTVLDAIRKERERQDAKWGEQNHTPIEWLAVLTEEVGEAAQSAINVRFRADDDLPENARAAGVREWARFYRHEMIHVAAVAVAAIESIDRNELAGR